jgi:hypothetical protein
LKQRKTLIWLAWCREELEYGAQEIIESLKSLESKSNSIHWDLLVLKRVQQEFEDLSRVHKDTKASEFNDDHKYRSITTEAIDLKSLALRKLEIFVQLYRLHNADDKGQLMLQEAIDRPIRDFAEESVIMELQTGIRHFPWTQLIQKNVSVDFDEWSPDGLDFSKIEKLISALTTNDELRTVTMGAKKERLILKGGWATAELLWDGSAAVQASIGVVALLLRCFSRLSHLSLRCGPSCSIFPLPVV